MREQQVSLRAGRPIPNRFSTYLAAAQQDNRFVIKTEYLQYLLILGIIVLLRVTDLEYRTIFVDEAIYATVGSDALVGDFNETPLAWMFGSYLYPVAVTLADQFAGIVGMRLLSAIGSVIASVFVLLFTRMLFGRRVALWSLIIFGLAGNSISVGTLAVYDAMALPFLACAVFFIVLTTMTRNNAAASALYAFTAALSLTLSILAKYITAAYIPVLVLLAGSLYLAQGRSLLRILLRTPWPFFLLPLILILGGYVAVNIGDLVEAFGTNRPSDIVEQGLILQDIWAESGYLIPVAYVGMLWVHKAPFMRVKLDTRFARLAFLVIAHVLFITFLVLPITHYVTHNARALAKHMVYTLVFLTPLMGYVVDTLIQRVRQMDGPWTRILHPSGALVTLILFLMFLNYSLDRNWGFQHSWPSVADVIKYLEGENLNENTRALASGGAIYRYYFDFGEHNDEVWLGTWGSNWKYDDVQGVEAMKAAIEDCFFDYVILDNHYTPDIDLELQGPLTSSGYQLGFVSLETLSTGSSISTRVYVSNESENCEEDS